MKIHIYLHAVDDDKKLEKILEKLNQVQLALADKKIIQQATADLKEGTDTLQEAVKIQYNDSQLNKIKNNS